MSLLSQGRDRAQWSAYGFIAGILIGLVLGWLFHGVIGTVVNFLIVAALLTPFIIAFIFWRRTKERIEDLRTPDPVPTVPLDRGDPIDAPSYVIRERSESREQ
jgi:Na+-driven multidrug efflux pump